MVVVVVRLLGIVEVGALVAVSSDDDNGSSTH